MIRSGVMHRIIKSARCLPMFATLSWKPNLSMYTLSVGQISKHVHKSSQNFALQGPHLRRMASTGSQNIHVEELKKLQQDSSVLIIDVREKEEIDETGILPGAVHIPLGELTVALSKSPDEFQNIYKRTKPDKGSQIVFSCRSGKRSLAGLNKAKELGYTNLLNFAGGWQEWEAHLQK